MIMRLFILSICFIVKAPVESVRVIVFEKRPFYGLLLITDPVSPLGLGCPLVAGSANDIPSYQELYGQSRVRSSSNNIGDVVKAL